jgi:formamidopyrimidine-DNA glycosylase
MPELPEVETVRRGLAERVVGRRLLDVSATGTRTARRTSTRQLIDTLEGVTVQSVERYGKYLVLHGDDEVRAMIHLRMSGQLLVAPRASPRPPHTHVTARLGAHGVSDPDEELRFVDPRTFGEVVAYRAGSEADVVPELGRLGWDPLREPEAMNWPRWRRLLAGRRRQLKALLLDQHVIAGLGNIYSDEVLHRARLRPQRRSDEVSAPQARRLLDAISSVLEAAVAAGGSTLGDAQYVDVEGRAGRYQLQHRVVGHAGQWCLSCGRARVRRVVSAGRSTSFCPWCQR